MKAWEVSFANQKGEPQTLLLNAEQRPSEEDAARAIRSRLFPLMDELDLNDFRTAVIPHRALAQGAERGDHHHHPRSALKRAVWRSACTGTTLQ